MKKICFSIFTLIFIGLLISCHDVIPSEERSDYKLAENEKLNNEERFGYKLAENEKLNNQDKEKGLLQRILESPTINNFVESLSMVSPPFPLMGSAPVINPQFISREMRRNKLY